MKPIQEMTVRELTIETKPVNVWGFYECIVDDRHIAELERREEERLRLLKEIEEIRSMLDCHRNNIQHGIRDLLDRLGE